MNDTVQRIIAFFLFLAALPLLSALCLFSLICSGRPVIYRSRRLGLGRRMFVLYKFRTMENCAPPFLGPEQREEWHLYAKLRFDDRVTRWGHWLRRSSLDELPQLLNVIRGEMNLVGPRPIVPEEEVLCGRHSLRIHTVKPGITGLWQVSGRNLVPYRRRNAINLYYVRHRSWKLDLLILLRTFGAVIGGRGAY
ncbi:MAG: sugar transferase [Lentisphaeria bacterium]|nr:sugar transferase [Lentisphaeria bacterium]